MSPTDRCANCNKNRVYCEAVRDVVPPAVLLSACCDACDHEVAKPKPKPEPRRPYDEPH